MYSIIKNIHSYTAYFALTFLIIAVLYTAFGWFTKSKFSKTAHLARLLGLISSHIQLLIGLFLYFVYPLGFSSFSSEAMNNSSLRLYILEHPLMMLFAIILITYGYRKSKSAVTDKEKFKFVAIFYSLGLLGILLRIPWSAWL
jgi:uncharacterized membrane protein